MNYNLFCSWLQLLDLMLFISDWSYSIPLIIQIAFDIYTPSKSFDVHIFQFISPIQFCARDLSSYILGILALPARPAWKIRSLSKECVRFIRFVVSTIWWCEGECEWGQQGKSACLCSLGAEPTLSHSEQGNLYFQDNVKMAEQGWNSARICYIW